MKSRVLVIICMCIGFVIIAIIFLGNGNKNFEIKTSNIIRVTIQYKTDIISIEDPEELKRFLNSFSTLEFVLNSNAIGSKGWVYWIKCYSSDKLIYDFTIQDEHTIKYNRFFYKTKSDCININYMENLFK